MRDDTMGNAEMAILAAQARANISRLRDFVTFDDAVEKSFDTVDDALKGLIEPIADAGGMERHPLERDGLHDMPRD